VDVYGDVRFWQDAVHMTSDRHRTVLENRQFGSLRKAVEKHAVGTGPLCMSTNFNMLIIGNFAKTLISALIFAFCRTRVD
jgi:hypothetical protein